MLQERGSEPVSKAQKKYNLLILAGVAVVIVLLLVAIVLLSLHVPASKEAL